MPKRTKHPKLRAHSWRTGGEEVRTAYYYDIPEAPMKPTAWLVHAQYPFVTMDPPIEGGLPRTELFTREQIATELRRLHAENERLRIEAQNSKEAWDALTDHAEKVRAENERLRNGLEHIAGSCAGRAVEVARAALKEPQ